LGVRTTKLTPKAVKAVPAKVKPVMGSPNKSQASKANGPCIKPTIKGSVIKGPIPTISIILIAVACPKDKPLSKLVFVALSDNYIGL
jgi:hypothetical protein